MRKYLCRRQACSECAHAEKEGRNHALIAIVDIDLCIGRSKFEFCRETGTELLLHIRTTLEP